MKKVAVTGTKGKTTIVRIINDLLLYLGYKTVSVESETVKLNGQEVFNQDYSKNVYGIIPSKCPGRFLYLGYDKDKERWNCDFSILETVIGCYEQGLGYQSHDVGIFTNIFEDHIGSGGIKSRKDLVDRKRHFISKLENNGILVYNYDEILIRNKIKNISNEKLLVTKKKAIIDKYKSGILIDKTTINIKINGKRLIYNTQKNKMSMYGLYTPSVINLGFILGGTLSLLGKETFFKKYKKIESFLNNYTMDIYGGRMIYIKYKGINIILDYAHEKESLKEILKLGNKIKSKGSKTTAIVRLAPDRENKVYKETGKYISEYADNFIVYDKIDGIDREFYISPSGAFKRKPGEVMKIFSKSIIGKKDKNVTEVIYRKDAIKYGLKISKKGDCLIIIVNDPKETGKFLEKLLGLKK